VGGKGLDIFYLVVKFEGHVMLFTFAKTGVEVLWGGGGGQEMVMSGPPPVVAGKP